jgi:hypothetical protein
MLSLEGGKMENKALRTTAIEILEWLNFDTTLASVQADADEIVQMMLDNGLEATNE